MGAPRETEFQYIFEVDLTEKYNYYYERGKLPAAVASSFHPKIVLHRVIRKLVHARIRYSYVGFVKKENPGNEPNFETAASSPAPPPSQTHNDKNAHNGWLSEIRNITRVCGFPRIIG